MIKRVLLILLFISPVAAFCQLYGISKDFLLGRSDHSKDTSFIKVSPVYSEKVAYLKKETYKAFLAMYAAALKDDVRLRIISAERSFYDQKYIWELKWNSKQFSGIINNAERAKKILRWSSMPGTSRHHWGTDVNLNNLKLAYYKTPEGIKLYKWLCNNGARFGFYQPFSSNRASGYQEEKWHWSYVPLSRIYIKEYLRQITLIDIFGFTGAHVAKELNIIQNWVSAVNPLVK